MSKKTRGRTPKIPETAMQTSDPEAEINVGGSSVLDDVDLNVLGDDGPWYDNYISLLKRNYHTADVTAPYLGAWYADESMRHLGMDFKDGYDIGLEDIRDMMVIPTKMHPRDVISALDTIADHLSPIRYVEVTPEELLRDDIEDDYFEERFAAWGRGYQAAVTVFGRLIGAESKFDPSTASPGRE